MIRFIINFILFGLLFYAIWLFFPEAFAKLTTWAGDLFTYVRELFNQIGEKLKTEPAQPKTTTVTPALLFLYHWIRQ